MKIDQRVIVLKNHSYNEVIGTVEIRYGRLVLRLLPDYPITKEIVFSIFPTGGFILRPQANEAEIFEVSLCGPGMVLGLERG